MLLAVTPMASAADFEMPPAEPQGWGWYLSVFGGWSMPTDEVEFGYSSVIGPTTAISATANVDLDDGFMAGAALGVQFNEWLRGEVEASGHWHDAEGQGTVIVDPPTVAASTSFYNIEGDGDALFVLANLWVDLPLGDIIRPYIGGGIGFGRLELDLHARSTTAPTTGFVVVDDSDWGFAYQVGAGIAFNVSQHLALDIGYRFKAINNLDFEADPVIGGFDFEVDYESHNVLAGLRVGF
jgi:opacity protein-like surface antigen